jgi:peptidoglycan hydrolase CwlO-like protein
MNEERSNLLKKIDSLEKDIEKMNEDINEYK